MRKKKEVNVEVLRLIMANISYYQALKGVNDFETAKGLNMSRQMFSLYRSGKSFPTFDKLLIIASFLGCSVEDLIRLEAPNSNGQISATIQEQV